MYRSKPRNRKVKQPAPRPKRPGRRVTGQHPLEELKSESHQLHAEIGSLEEVIASLVLEEERQEEMRRQNILPPPDYGKMHHRHHSGPERLTHAERRRMKKERRGSLYRFLFLLAIAGGLVFWLMAID